MKGFFKPVARCMLFVMLTGMTFLTGLTVLSSQQKTAHAAENFVYRCGTHFCLGDRYFYFAGANTYDVFTYGDGSSSSTPDDIENKYMDKAKIDAHMAALQSDGVSVLRLWMFSHETWHGFEPSKGVYNEAEFALFDYIIQSAKAHNIRLLPTLENYWTAYGGIDTRLQWEGLPTGDANRWMFFNKTKCPGCFTQYKNYVHYVLNRVNHYSGVAYKDEPTIFAWELMNEPRYQNATPNENSTGTTLRAWVDEMASYIKSIDSHHMVGTGIEGHQAKYGFGGDEGNPFVYLQQSPFIDFTSAHPYPTEEWAHLSLDQTKQLIDAWVNDSHNVIGKPFFMGEFNVKGVDRSTWWREIYGELERLDVAGSAFWWYQATNVDSTYGVSKGAPELAVFRQHSANQQAKNVPINATPTPGITPTVSPTITPTPGATCSVRYTIESQWPDGFTGKIKITNNGSSTINGWTLAFSFAAGQKVQQGWSATWSQSGANVTVTNASWNGTIAPSGSVEIGFNGSWKGSNPVPATFTLNGTVCQ
ncbi:mannan endo-1,4-beta-mannosidase [Thermosporothrix hazakensis]|uniref:Mannan endo-1,4-beta-mannosidase n=1 Tax=Thermosporothrix hazakensis TaxID=644383 RepID=A0A326UDG3_THEHA|nr:cellulose binding domain-containing protein [Thermosporothrix hazakensis]PZW32774.1 mannan endo-1,4-beta-mannosidase [Thermosporothrix hazakensis]GCE50130.1 hypothetical protein KTH_49990 [Thermosporothrix hazakensis]